MTAKYMDNPKGVVFSFCLSDETIWAWVSKGSLEDYAKRNLSPEECILTYRENEASIHESVLKNREIKKDE